MTSPDLSILTEQWGGHPLYICAVCGKDTFTASVLETHRCLPVLPLRESTLPVPQDPEPAPMPAKSLSVVTRKKGTAA